MVSCVFTIPRKSRCRENYTQNTANIPSNRVEGNGNKIMLTEGRRFFYEKLTSRTFLIINFSKLSDLHFLSFLFYYRNIATWNKNIFIRIVNIHIFDSRKTVKWCCIGNVKIVLESVTSPSRPRSLISLTRVISKCHKCRHKLADTRPRVTSTTLVVNIVRFCNTNVNKSRWMSLATNVTDCSQHIPWNWPWKVSWGLTSYLC